MATVRYLESTVILAPSCHHRIGSFLRMKIRNLSMTAFFLSASLPVTAIDLRSIMATPVRLLLPTAMLRFINGTIIFWTGLELRIVIGWRRIFPLCVSSLKKLRCVCRQRFIEVWIDESSLNLAIRCLQRPLINSVSSELMKKRTSERVVSF